MNNDTPIIDHNPLPGDFVSADQMLTATSNSTDIEIPAFDAAAVHPPDVNDLIPHTTLFGLHVVPLARSDHAITLGVAPDTNHQKLRLLITEFKNLNLSFGALSAEHFQLMMNRLYLGRFEEALKGDFESFTEQLAAAPPKAAFSLIAELAYLLEESEPSDVLPRDGGRGSRGRNARPDGPTTRRTRSAGVATGQANHGGLLPR